MLTLLALSMYRGFGLQQKIAGNTRDKERAYQVAESSLQYAESWLPKQSSHGVVCAGNVTVTSDTNMRVCSNVLATPEDPSKWTNYLEYKLPAMVVAGGGGVTKDGNNVDDINYAKVPGMYVAYLGLSPGGQHELYSVTASASGGVADTTSVVQSVYAVSLPYIPY